MRRQACFALTCLSVTGRNPYPGGDVICAVRTANSRIQGAAWNMVAWNLPTSVGRKLRRQLAGCPPCWAQSSPLSTSEEAKDTRREQPTLLVPSAVRSPGNLRRKTSTCLSSSSRHGPGDGCFAGRGMKLGEPWAVLTGASQGSIRPWTDGQFLNS